MYTRCLGQSGTTKPTRQTSNGGDRPKLKKLQAVFPLVLLLLVVTSECHARELLSGHTARTERTGSSKSSTGISSRSSNQYGLTGSSSSSRPASGDHSRHGLTQAATQLRSPSSHASSSSSRRLLQLDLKTCPIGCLDDYCAEGATSGGLRCLECADTLVVDRLTGLCGCPPGRFKPDDTMGCSDCPKGFWCPGGVITASSVPPKNSCGTGMTTVGIRSPGASSCVNIPGYAFRPDAQGMPLAELCPADTWNSGMRRQRTCYPCPLGYSTNGATGRSSITDCIVPAGSYMQFPTIISLCPQGQWKSSVGSGDSCTSCPEGTTTAAAGATSAANCTLLQPGYYAATINSGAITLARPCPQKFVCPGGKPAQAFNPNFPTTDATILRCPSGTWTVAPGASDLVQCFTPPGHYTWAGVTNKCPTGSYRANWVAAGTGINCTSCGEGVFAQTDNQVAEYTRTFPYTATNIAVTTSPSSCYIKTGQGLYYVVKTSSWRARNCVNDNWGVNTTTYNLQLSNCRSCPLNMLTSTNAAVYPTSASYYVSNGDGTGGFISKWACVTRPGYGFNGTYGRGFSYPCDLGTYNSGDNWSVCTACGHGLTTAAPGAGVRFSDCGTAPGFGYNTSSSSIVQCPKGAYNDRTIDYTRQLPCKTCPTGTTTGDVESKLASDCDLCIPGYGNANCATQCGGIGASATYGTGERDINTPCAACNLTDLSYNISGTAQTYTAIASSKAGATSVNDCMSTWANFGATWYLQDTGPAESYSQAVASSLSACLDRCSATTDCQFVTYWNSTSVCRMRLRATILFSGAHLIAFKTVKAGQPSTPSGAYSYWQDPNAVNTLGQILVGQNQTVPTNAASFTSDKDCSDACDADPNCAAFTLLNKADLAARWQSCTLLGGAEDVEARSFVRADTTKLVFPVLL